jgi:RNA polymerase sigma factor (sigma-70 family)
VEQLLALRRAPVRLDPGGENRALLEVLADERSPDPGESLRRKETSARIHGAIGHLSTRQRQVVRQRYGLEDGEPRTLEQTGRTLGVSRERVRQVERHAMDKLFRILSFEKAPSGLTR